MSYRKTVYVGTTLNASVKTIIFTGNRSLEFFLLHGILICLVGFLLSLVQTTASMGMLISLLSPLSYSQWTN